MCDASTITMGASAVSAIGNLMEGKQTQKFYNYKADQAEADANYEIGMAQVRASRVQKAGVLQQGAIKAGYAGSGIDVNSGTPLDVKERVAADISLDATTELLTGQRRAAVLRAQAMGDLAAGSRAVTSSYLGAGRSLLAGTAQEMDARTKADKWARRRTEDFAATKRAQFTGFGDGEF